MKNFSSLLSKIDITIPQAHINRLETLGCTSTFFNKRNLVDGTALLLTPLEEPTDNHNLSFFSTKGGVNPVLLMRLLIGSVTIVALFLYSRWQISARKNITENEEHFISLSR